MASDLEKNLGYTFKQPALMAQALTHASLRSADNYERLEFLGDRVLGLAVAALLYNRFPAEAEGALAKRHTALVQQSALSAIAQEIGVPAAVQLSDAERSAGGARKDAILADALEALIAAVFLDGGYPSALAVVEKLFENRLTRDVTPPEDPKTRLQEWAQAKGLPLPIYEVIGQTGPDHAPLFRVVVRVEGHEHAQAEAASKRAAEKAAAAALLRRMGEMA